MWNTIGEMIGMHEIFDKKSSRAGGGRMIRLDGLRNGTGKCLVSDDIIY